MSRRTLLRAGRGRHSWLRGLFCWWWAFLVAASVLLGWLLGDWHSAWSILQPTVPGAMALILVGLIVAGFVELRGRRTPGD